ncbi:MAG: ABC transporter permease [Verrucomicrobia bacterium]|nr:ABC transporter permease [Verrucomicrobiota bacterium]
MDPPKLTSQVGPPSPQEPTRTGTADVAGHGGKRPGKRRSSILLRLLEQREASVFLMLALVAAYLSISSAYFLAARNLLNIGRQFSVVGITAIGEALVIISGGIDLSVGSVIGLAAVVSALVVKLTGSPALGLAAGLLSGALVGLINGLLYTRVRINPFIATLGMLSVARGAALLLTGGLPIRFENWVAFLGSGYVSTVPASFSLMLALAVVAHVFTTRTRWGRNIFAVGDNPRAARLGGINVGGVRRFVFLVSGTLAALGGIVLAGTLNSSNPNLGQGYELDVIAAVILGGAALSGGRGSIFGVILGAALMGVLRNAFVLLGVSAYWQVVTIGIVVILAVGIDSVRRHENV